MPSSPTPAKSGGPTKAKLCDYAHPELRTSEGSLPHQLQHASGQSIAKSCVILAAHLLPKNATNTRNQIAQTQKVFCESLCSAHRQASGQSIAKQTCLPRQHQQNQKAQPKPCYAAMPTLSSEPQKVHSLTSCSMLREKALRSRVSSLLDTCCQRMQPTREIK